MGLFNILPSFASGRVLRPFHDEARKIVWEPLVETGAVEEIENKKDH
jgi:hypothetical protein